MDMGFIFHNVLGKTGVVGAIGFIIFIFTFRNSVKLFEWIEDQTFGTRDYILKKCEFLFWEIQSHHVTWFLLGVSFGLASLVYTLFLIFGKYVLGVFVSLFVWYVGWRLPRPLIDFFVQRRIKKFEGQMVDALNLLSNGLRAGLSFQQALGMVVTELPEPISQEFNIVLQQTRIGVSLEESLNNLCERVPTEDNEMFVTCVNILRETGGNLSETFDTIAGVIRERVRLKQKIDTATAQGKTQGIAVFSIPFFILFIFSTGDANFADNIFGTVWGVIILVMAFGLNFLGGYLMLRAVRIKL